MEFLLWEMIQLVLRCLHVVTGIAWIGASFYFVWLDNHLRKPTAPDLLSKGVDGELWAVHGGGFYNPQKYMVAPATLPQNLHWFYWESYSTWLSGFALLVVTYLMNPKALLIDEQVFSMSSHMAVFYVIGILVGGWILYHLSCKVFEMKPKTLGVVTFGIVALIAVANHHFLSGRASFLVTGACMATIMTANVLFVIIPGQRKVIELMRKNASVDAIYGMRGKQRSVHNTYFTLPVVFAMLSNHFSFMTNHANRLPAFLVMMIAAVLIRQFFVLRHKGKTSFGMMGIAVILIFLASLLVLPKSNLIADSPSIIRVHERDILAISQKRCVQCHSAKPTLVPEAPKGLILESELDIYKNRKEIYTQVVLSRAMPLGNVTGIEDSERDMVRLWFETQ
ncbi:MAG: urate hydroxylase PuuD [Proteobacteria bacterium]|nr:urate hydroxylase PuuD [Pseudomonadota bacterium]